jgi:hypothetical protein
MILLTTKNAKLMKSNGTGYRAAGLSLAPHKQSGISNLCPFAGRCAKDCVTWFTGRTVTKTVRNAAINRTRLFVDARESFIVQLCDEIERFERRCIRNGEVCCVRLNVASDVRWESVAPILFDRFPNVRFYDYTKDPYRFGLLAAKGITNYSLTYSVSERTADGFAGECLENGHNVAIICAVRYVGNRNICDPIPEWLAVDGDFHRTVDGDKSDLRLSELDGTGRVVLLRYKGAFARRAESVAADLTWDFDYVECGA